MLERLPVSDDPVAPAEVLPGALAHESCHRHEISARSSDGPAVSRVCCFTSCTYSYLTRANILMRTVRAAHPDWEIWAVIVDMPPPGTEPDQLHRQFDHVVFAQDLGISDFRSWLFKHDIVEACTAVKGHMLSHLLRQGAAKVIYLDPDIAVFGGLADILDRLDTYAIVLTPHQVAPNTLPAVVADNEGTSSRYGIFNLGFLGVRNNAVGLAFAEWWSAQLHRACYDDTANGIFTDQKYCDLVPGLFDGVYIERDPGCNVASWNLSRRRITIRRDGAILVNGSALKFYHFTKIGSAGDVMTAKYGGSNIEVFEIWNWYKRVISAGPQFSIPQGFWHYGMFENGELIPRAARLLFRANPRWASRFPDPYRVGQDSFHEFMKSGGQELN